MSTHVIGFKPPDERWSKMKAAYDACQAAGVDPPREVEVFFGGEPPDDQGVQVEERTLRGCGAVSDWQVGCQAGFEIDVTKLPKDVTVVRVYNAW